MSGSSSNDPVTYPALSESGLPGLPPAAHWVKTGPGPAPPFTLFLRSGISPCALPSGAGIGLIFSNPGPQTSRVQAACFPTPGQGEDGSGNCTLFLLHLPTRRAGTRPCAPPPVPGCLDAREPEFLPLPGEGLLLALSSDVTSSRPGHRHP